MATLVGNAASVERMRAEGSGQGEQRVADQGDKQQRTLNEWARESLRNHFSLVEPGAERTAGNQVTAEEYAEITETFADIYRGRSDIQIDDSLPAERRDAFKMGVMNDLARVMQTPSGRELVDSLHRAPSRGFLKGDRKTTITQHGGGNGDPSNALGGGDPGDRGTVAYVPGVNHGPDENLRSDVVLYHEMVHAHHAVYDTWDHDPTSVDNGATRIDAHNGVGEHEHQAVGLGEHAQARFSENRYRQERRAIGASNHGEVHGAQGDDNLAYRDTYLGFDD